MSEPAVWRVNGASELDCWYCGTEAMVYHVDSGDTHCLSHFAALTLDLLQDRSLTSDQLAVDVAAKLGFAKLNADINSSVITSLTEMMRVGLTEQL